MVKTMMVIGHPSDTGWIIECAMCGPVTVVDSTQVNKTCSAHLATHTQKKVVAK